MPKVNSRWESRHGRVCYIIRIVLTLSEQTPGSIVWKAASLGHAVIPPEDGFAGRGECQPAVRTPGSLGVLAVDLSH